MAPDRSAQARAAVTAYEDIGSHRRTQQFVDTLVGLGWSVTKIATSPGLSAASVEYVTIGFDGNAAATRGLRGLLRRNAKNASRFAITVLTLFPGGAYSVALEWSVRRILRLEGLVREMREGLFSVVVVTDPLCLPSVLGHRGSMKVVFDAREFFPRQFEYSGIWRLLFSGGLTRLLRNRLPDCDAVTTVSHGLATGYRDLCGVEPVVVLNVPPCADAHPSYPGVNRSPATPLRLVYHGGANRNRRLDVLIDMARLLGGRAHLDLYLIGRPRHLRPLERLASTVPNVRLRTPVAFTEIPAMLLQYDVGLSVFPPSTFNLRHAMPSKFFEYLHAGLAVAVGAAPDMAEVVRSFDCGVVVEEFTGESLARAFADLSGQRLQEMRQNAAAAARQLCADVEYARVGELLQSFRDGP